MMNILEEAIIYATIMHQGRTRKLKGAPFILHPLEVAHILSTMTEDHETIAAGILHDIVEDTDGTLDEIEKRFGKRVAMLVASESENDFPGMDRRESWKRRKEEALIILKNSDDIGVKMLWLADKLANIRSIAAMYSEKGEELWHDLDQSDSGMQRWYYKTIAETVELSLNKTGAFKELIKHINFIWPGTFDSEKGRYRKYKEVSVEGCEVIGRGAKGDVYRYDEELIIKVFNQKNTYKDVEKEIALSRRAFILGVPTAISFGIVSVGTRYGAMYELVDSDTVSRIIARSPGKVNYYAGIMAEVAHTIHDIDVSDDDTFPYAAERLFDYIEGGVGVEDENLAEKCRKLLSALPASTHLIHGDFHTNNVFLQKGEPLLIDMDRLSKGHPIAEISDLYYFYVVLGEDDPLVVENFMGFSYSTAKEFFHSFLMHYLATDDEERIREVTEKASLMCYTRVIRMIHKQRHISEADENRITRCLGKIAELTEKLDTLEF
ncbi:MAG: HD domain-containing protein [Lachnospiraceae bacterium]|nr:HD domain-containing protein [Lachnospiraceae bacterium]